MLNQKFEAVIQRLENMEELLGSAEDIMIDDGAMNIVRDEIEALVSQIRDIQHMCSPQATGSEE